MRNRISWSKVLSIVLALSLLVGMAPYLMGRTIARQPTDDEAVTAGGNVIPDAGFKKNLNQTLSKLTHTDRQDDEPVTIEDMAKISQIRIYGYETINSIEGIQYAFNLVQLYINRPNVAGMEQIRALKNLEALQLHNSTVDLSWFADLTKLEILTLTGCTGFKDLKALGYKPALVHLSLDRIGKEGAVSLESLDGLSPEKFPVLSHLNIQYCSTLKDISALSKKLPKLSSVDMSSLNTEGNFTDFSPLKGYTTLKKLNLEKMQITDQNRESYKEMIRSLVNLEELYMPYCEVSDQDVDMFMPLQKLKTLCLNVNNLTNTDFCAYLPRDIQVLGLYGNRITNMDNIGGLTNLRILGMGGNGVTNFRFLNKLLKLTNESICHVEGTAHIPAFETHEIGDFNNPVTIGKGGTLEVDNPYVDINGNPISFENAMVPEDVSYMVRYDADTNKVIFENLTSGFVSTVVVYEVPLAGGEAKHFAVRIWAHVKVGEKYHVSYDWGTEFPDGQKLPVDNSEYNTEAEAQAAKDKLFTNKTTVAGTRNGKEGTWRFSGWTWEVQGNEVHFVGSWTFVGDKYTVIYDWGTEFPDGQKLPAVNAVYDTEAEAQAAMDKQFTHKTTVAGTCNGKEGTWRFSGWTANEADENHVVTFTGIWQFTQKDTTPGGSPDTGDDILWMCLLVITSAAALATTVYARKKHN